MIGEYLGAPVISGKMGARSAEGAKEEQLMVQNHWLPILCGLTTHL